MRYIVLVLMFLFVTLAFAKSDVKFEHFNAEMSENIETVIKNNPQIYEQNPVKRSPASVDIEKENLEEFHEDTEDKFNTFDQQNIGSEKW